MCAHEFETGFFVGERAWHGLGNVVQKAPTVQDALELSGLNWQVLELPISVPYDDGKISETEDWKALVRSTDYRILSVQKRTYTVVQNSEAFAFFNPFLHEGNCTLETAGSLRRGQRIFISARIQGLEGEVKSGDKIDAFLLLYNSHDGSLSVGVCFTPIRVVCNNTLTAAVSETDKTAIKIRHRSGVHDALRQVQDAIDVNRQTFAYSLEQYREIERKKLPVDGFRQYVRQVFDVPDEETKMPRAWETLESLYDTAPGQTDLDDSYWRAYNAVTYWTAHERGRTDASRLDSNWFGPSANLRQRALTVALES